MRYDVCTESLPAPCPHMNENEITEKIAELKKALEEIGIKIDQLLKSVSTKGEN